MNKEPYESSGLTISLDIREYILILWHWAWVILLTGAVAGGLVYLLLSRNVQYYAASTLLLVSEPPASMLIDTSQSAIVPSNMMAQTYTQMLTNLPVLQEVIDQLKIPVDPQDLKSNIDVLLIKETQLIRVTVKDTDPQRAADIANTLGKVFAERIQNLQGVRYAQSKDNLNKQLTEMEAQLKEVSTQLGSTTDPQEKDRLTTLQTQYRQIYATLVASFEQLRMAEAQAVTIVVQVDPAVKPTAPVNASNMLYFALAALIGMLMAAGLIVVLSLQDDRVRKPDELVNQFNLPILGVIAHHAPGSPALVTLAQPESASAEAYRTLRTNLQHTDANLRCILVASPTPEDGKTTVAANLGVIMARNGLRTTLLDADMRWPRAHAILGLPNHAGLANLYKQSDLSLDAFTQQTNQGNLSLVSPGQPPSNPAELLGTRRTGQILNLLKKHSDAILVDCPPFLTVTDAAVLAPLVDGVLVVVRAGHTRINTIRRMVAALRQKGITLLGLVINDVHFEDVRYRYYYRDYYHQSARTRLEDGEQPKGQPEALEAAIQPAQEA